MSGRHTRPRHHVGAAGSAVTSAVTSAATSTGGSAAGSAVTSAGGSTGSWAGRGERGSASVLGIGVVVGLSTVLVLALGLVAVLVAGQQARTAADLGALAAAGQMVQGLGDDAACARARQVAHEHGTSLQSCVVDPAGASPWPEVTVQVERPVIGTRWTVSVRARAGATAARATPS